MANGVCVVNGGVAILTNRIIQAGTAPKYQEWGTGTTTPAVTDTALQTPSSESRTAGTESRSTTTVTNDTYTVTGTIVATGTRAITEYGQFDASTSGNMLIHAVFSVVNLVVGEAIAFTSNLKLAAYGP